MQVGRAVEILTLILIIGPDLLLAANPDDYSLPGRTRQDRQIFKKLLVNYNPEDPPIDGISNITVAKIYCYQRFNEKERAHYLSMYMKMSWTDQRLVWNNSTVTPPRAVIKTRNNTDRLWLPRFTWYSVRARYWRVSIASSGAVTAGLSIAFKFYCRPIARHKFPTDQFLCTNYYANSNRFQIYCKGEKGFNCCLKKKRRRPVNYMWRVKKIQPIKEYTRPKYQVTSYRMRVLLQRQSAGNHFFITPVILVALMSALQCLVNAHSAKRHLLTCLLIIVTLGTMLTIMEVPVIRTGGGERLVSLCSGVIGFNMAYLIWSAVSVNVLTAGGISALAVRTVVEKADRYRLFLGLPSHVEVAETCAGRDAATWAYLSLVVDRALFVVWFLVVVIYAAIV